MKKKFVCMLLTVLMGLGGSLPVVSAGELDVLLEKLVDKGVLSPVEATIIKDETKQTVAAEVADGKSYAVPAWVQKMKVGGDLRLRYQYDDANSIEPRHRGRMRFRLGVETKVAKTVKVGFGLASGSDDSRSSNVTFDNNFSSKDIRLDLAFAEWTPIKGLNLVGGKFKRKKYLWVPTDLTWDGDINPEGASAHWESAMPGLDNTDYWVNGGIWMLEEDKTVDSQDPWMKYIQTGIKLSQGIVDVKTAAMYYSFHGIKERTLTNSAGTNSTGSTGLLSNYPSFHVGSEIGFKKLFGGLPLDIDERIAFFGEFVHNLDSSNIDSKRSGWSYGLKFGNKKVKKGGQWQFKYIKAILGKDAWLDSYPDSDRLSGGTDVLSHEVILLYGLKKNIYIGLDYYYSRKYSQAAHVANNKKVNHTMQGDINFKF